MRNISASLTLGLLALIVFATPAFAGRTSMRASVAAAVPASAVTTNHTHSASETDHIHTGVEYSATSQHQRLADTDKASTCDVAALKRVADDLCTHGPDPWPNGYANGQRVTPVQQSMAASLGTVDTPTVLSGSAGVCDADGTTGPRVQVLYVRAADVSSRYAEYLVSFQTWAIEMDDIFAQSAAETGGMRHVRFVHDAVCQPVVGEVILSPTGDDTIGNTAEELSALGYTATDRKYVLFVDTDGFCGVSGMVEDDQPGPYNANNWTSGFAQVSNSCWGSWVAAHELMHTLGGVQSSAPHASGGLHCIDTIDVMCYSDDPFYPEMQLLCPDHWNRFDCNHDDYYSTNVAPGSYLDTHWNTADSAFLIGGVTLPPPDTSPPTISWTQPIGNQQVHPVTNGPVSLEVTATDDIAVAQVSFSRWDALSELWVDLATVTTSPYGTTIEAATLDPDWNYISASAADRAGNTAGDYIWVLRQQPVLSVGSMTLGSAASTTGYTLTSEIAVISAGAGILGTSVVAQWTDSDGGIIEQTALTDASGVATFTHSVGATGTYSIAVTDTVLAAYTYDAVGNTISSTSITLDAPWFNKHWRSWWGDTGQQPWAGSLSRPTAS